MNYFSAFVTLLLVATNLIFSPAAFANHEHHNSFGSHGMALIVIDKQLIASHMPLHNSMHEHQIIFTTEVDQRLHKKLINLIKNNQLTSLLPERFALKDLQNGLLASFTATVFQGHFERGGKPVLENVHFTVSKMLYQNKLGSSLSNSTNGNYQLVKINQENWLAIHQISAKPSFDHLAWLKISEGNKQQFIKTNGKPLSNTTAFDEFRFHQSLYLETLDFQ